MPSTPHPPAAAGRRGSRLCGALRPRGVELLREGKDAVCACARGPCDGKSRGLLLKTWFQLQAQRDFSTLNLELGLKIHTQRTWVCIVFSVEGQGEDLHQCHSCVVAPVFRGRGWMCHVCEPQVSEEPPQ